ncbi:GTP cyclohydrolase I [Herbiconiux sp. KACC 21604]|uniref:GTP cyclohydrolase I n=1 Tax=unclassified Herbiconiux TaxID=2618217 RepID=UPI0014916594|nr:GTP cyclohydrolase I [Herbiconiux sp. SALV-R1]QJU52317.1 GTP cyclohydrolase I [Herbiconiux sp. SALV-R1]WPO87165.1 GTP cyclohydrolase I [Herbiconiux sp. KACC 21604]
MSVDRDRIEAAVSEILAALGDDPAREGLQQTPRRVAELYAELFAGVGVDPAEALRSTFDSSPVSSGAAPETDARADERTTADDLDAFGRPAQPVLLRDIAFRSVCEHHLLPFEGVAHVAYVPSGRIAGLGSIVAVVESASSRLQLQERLTDDIADALERALDARGVLVVLDARHGCVTARGPRQTGSTTVTLSARGSLADPSARAEVTALLGATQGLGR